MARPSVSLSELSPDVQAALKARNPVLSIATRGRLGGAGGSALAGLHAQRSGKSFEQDVEAACLFYRSHARLRGEYVRLDTMGGSGLKPYAVIAKNNVPTAGNPRSRRGLRSTGKAIVDYSGVWSGQPIAFDAKVRTGKASFAILEDDEHQLEFLRDFRAAGGIAGYLIYDAELMLCWWLSDLDALVKSPRSKFYPTVAIRSKARGSGELTHHLPVLSRLDAPPSLTHPGLDFLSILRGPAPGR